MMGDQLTLTACNNRACDNVLPPYRCVIGVRKLYCWEQTHRHCSEVIAHARIDELARVTSQLRWLMANSDGVVGLRNDGRAMPWDEVRRLYMPAARDEVLG